MSYVLCLMTMTAIFVGTQVPCVKDTKAWVPECYEDTSVVVLAMLIMTHTA
jgi:hypothetical protein